MAALSDFAENKVLDALLRARLIGTAATYYVGLLTAGWLTAVSWGLYDALTGGNLWVHAPLTVAKTINTGDAVSFAAGALTVTMA